MRHEREMGSLSSQTRCSLCWFQSLGTHSRGLWVGPDHSTPFQSDPRGFLLQPQGLVGQSLKSLLSGDAGGSHSSLPTSFAQGAPFWLIPTYLPSGALLVCSDPLVAGLSYDSSREMTL